MYNILALHAALTNAVLLHESNEVRLVEEGRGRGLPLNHLPIKQADKLAQSVAFMTIVAPVSYKQYC